MNANNIIKDDMTLDEKLAAIEQAMKSAEQNFRKTNPDAPFDPSTLTICDGCE